MSLWLHRKDKQGRVLWYALEGCDVGLLVILPILAVILLSLAFWLRSAF